MTHSSPQRSFEFLNTALQAHSGCDHNVDSLSIKTITTAINQPDILQFESLLNSAAVKNLKNEPRVELLQVLMHASEYKKELPADIDQEMFTFKLRILRLSSLATDYLNKELPYDKVAKYLDIPLKDTEFWVINGTSFLS